MENARVWMSAELSRSGTSNRTNCPALKEKPFGLLQSKFVDVPGYDTVSEAGGGEAGDRHRIENVKM